MPDEFSSKAVRTVDMFRRKTIDLNIECMIYFDIHTGNIVFCSFSDDVSNEVNGMIYPELLKGMHIASPHNHPKRFSSHHSGKNFEMLGLEFEEYELIFAQNELRILESSELIFEECIIEEIRKNVNDYFDSIYGDINIEFEMGYEVIDNLNESYGNFLLNYLNGDYENIELTRKYLDE